MTKSNMFLNLTKLLQRMTAFLLALFIFLIVFGSVYNNQKNEPEVKHHVTKIISVPKKLIATPNAHIATIHSADADNPGNMPSTFDDNSQLAEAAAIVLWWTPFIYESEYTKNCGGSVCFFTGNQSYLKHEKLKVGTTFPIVTSYA